MQQFTLFFACLTALLSGLVSAHPGHGHDGPITIIRARDLNDTDTGSNSTAFASDTIPVFQAAECVCPAAVCDSRMNAKSICECQAQAKLACYLATKGACPQPADNTCE
ncbi:hypothetical protein N0V93_002965 [Gnomoniopsis smithogilvyi]|uniref:Uncharacterized protein n=1 Tax=Gnomoniopsis smithogilvyi TaxID=1191159 RepID=A0A9W8YVS7_9PEZI|nr:hypothetical protein N0V93_002965 [Gnomoniopsis smithogilvyi]